MERVLMIQRFLCFFCMIFYSSNIHCMRANSESYLERNIEGQKLKQKTRASFKLPNKSKDLTYLNVDIFKPVKSGKIIEEEKHSSHWPRLLRPTNKRIEIISRLLSLSYWVACSLPRMRNKYNFNSIWRYARRERKLRCFCCCFISLWYFAVFLCLLPVASLCQCFQKRTILPLSAGLFIETRARARLHNSDRVHVRVHIEAASRLERVMRSRFDWCCWYWWCCRERFYDHRSRFRLFTFRTAFAEKQLAHHNKHRQIPIYTHTAIYIWTRTRGKDTVDYIGCRTLRCCCCCWLPIYSLYK